MHWDTLNAITHVGTEILHQGESMHAVVIHATKQENLAMAMMDDKKSKSKSKY
jgi:hypothetical protein